jgi:hypothetical protein
MNIIISAPAYTHRSGGIRVLHYLGYLAKYIGHNVKMDSPHCNPEWGEYSGRIGKPDIKIIPEINPATLRSDGNIVRWVLYYPGMILNGPKVYPEHELVVSYHDEYDILVNLAAKRKPILKFCLPFCEIPTEGLKRNPSPEMRKNSGAVWYGKACRSALPTVEGAVEINHEWPQSRLELMQLLEDTNVLYSFDRNTTINDEALLCGCKVLLWQGIEFKEYVNPMAADVLMNYERDIKLTEKFLADVAEIFGIMN